ncbi:autotransporter assembly complex protein TamA [Sphingomonas sp. GlSt437]|uniref:autotransporter assembly complex protein TamA n=1 Tax=Sphingomonas sp. GlSt437 TaxID=3389970 RepID=UPI003A8A7599
MLVIASHGALACAVAGWLWAAAPPPAAPLAPAAPTSQAPAKPDPDAPMLDPDAPLAPMPDLGVAWPDLSKTDATAAVDTGKTAIAELSHYTYRIDGVEAIDEGLFRQRFEQLSSLRANQKGTANAAQIQRRAREDALLLTTLLEGQGYYDARVTTTVEVKDGRPEVVLTAEPGRLYRFAAVRLNGVTAAGDKAGALERSFGVGDGSAVDADKIAAGEEALRAELGHQGFAFGNIGQSAIVVDHATQTATLDLSVKPGTARNFGQITTPPNRIFDAHHIQQIARFHPGDAYDTTKVEDLRRAIIQTGLVSTLEIKPVPGAAPDAVDLAIKMEPAPPHTIAGQLGYGTGEGVRAEVDWTHRNFFPPEGALTFQGVLGTQEQSGGVIFRRNNFEGRDRVLTGQLIASNVRRTSYQATSATLSGSLERQTNIFFQKDWTWSVGAELTGSDERDVILSTGAPRRRTFFIAALPTSLVYDGSDDLLNPTKGFRLGLRLSPELSLEGKVFGYARVQLDGSVYKSITDKFVLAGRVRLGTIAGAPRDAVAPSRRYYAGGGASVRGYGYQDIGPRDPNNDPIGGRSLTEFSIEGRIRAFGNFGLVPFFDAGNIYTSALPKFTGLQYGAGLGVRYYTNFGPIRIDVGTPLNPQKGDPRVAVYVSLGQAF